MQRMTENNVTENDVIFTVKHQSLFKLLLLFRTAIFKRAEIINTRALLHCTDQTKLFFIFFQDIFVIITATLFFNKIIISNLNRHVNHHPPNVEGCVLASCLVQ